jgi:hypothetical protein
LEISAAANGDSRVGLSTQRPGIGSAKRVSSAKSERGCIGRDGIQLPSHRRRRADTIPRARSNREARHVDPMFVSSNEPFRY